MQTPEGPHRLFSHLFDSLKKCSPMQSKKISLKETPTCVLSVDVDDHLTSNADFFVASDLQGTPHQVERDIDKTLELFAEHNASATFFVNCQYFEKNQDPLRRILSAGHELASHGFQHRHVQNLSIEEFKADFLHSLDILHRVTDTVYGYRAPAFTMPYRDDYLQILIDAGIKYVSNGFGVNRADIPLDQRPSTLETGLHHIPISTQQILGGSVKYPIGYAVVARLLPELIVKYSVKKWLANNSYFHFYGHTFEFAGSQSPTIYNLGTISGSVSMLLYSLRCRNRDKLFEFILSRCQFRSIEQLLFGDPHAIEQV